MVSRLPLRRPNRIAQRVRSSRAAGFAGVVEGSWQKPLCHRGRWDKNDACWPAFFVISTGALASDARTQPSTIRHRAILHEYSRHDDGPRSGPARAVSVISTGATRLFPPRGFCAPGSGNGVLFGIARFCTRTLGPTHGLRGERRTPLCHFDRSDPAFSSARVLRAGSRSGEIVARSNSHRGRPQVCPPNPGRSGRPYAARLFGKLLTQIAKSRVHSSNDC